MTVNIFGFLVKGGLAWIMTEYGAVSVFVSLVLAFVGVMVTD